MIRKFIAAFFIIAFGGVAPKALALGGNSMLFCATYPESRLCVNGSTPCATCHDGTPPAVNWFGSDIRTEIQTKPGYSKLPRDFQRYLHEVLVAIEGEDSDRDGYLNGDEITRGYQPGNAQDLPVADDPGAYDPALALRRLSATYCGESPTFAAMQAMQAATDKRALLHTTLSRCLESDYWLNEGLPRLADDKIRPVGSLGGTGREVIVGDFKYDYRLYAHAMSGDRDARDLLKADYHIAADGSVIHGVINGRGGQPLQPEYRAGMLTTQWFIGNNTMFALLPRNSAAQAYRAYLGLDIARSEGLHPIIGEPRDPDHMGVRAPDCAVCHSTLDPLAYPFTPYMAFASRRLDGMPRPRGIPVGGYDATATAYLSGYLMGQPVRDLKDWADQAANSDEFKRTMARDTYRHAVGHEPQTMIEREEFDGLWHSIAEDGYSANRLIHRLVDTRSFGAVGPIARPNAIWKRYKQVANDLARAMQLDINDVCKEVGTYSCANQVFLTTLGGNDPFGKSQYRAARAPGVTTPIALERFVLSACSQRVMRDTRETPAVFTFIDLSKASLVDDVADVDRQTQDLYRRLHAREPLASETSVLRELLIDGNGQPVSAANFAKLACFVIGSTQEFLFQ